MPQEAVRQVAEKALEAATRAELAAVIAKNTSEGMVREMRERLDRQDGDSKEFRDWLKQEWAEFKTGNDAFKTDFDDMNQRCKGHDDVIYGNPQKNISGVCPKVNEHDGDIRKGKWTLGIAAVLCGWLVAYVLFFYGEAMRRGVFNPSEEEWRWRVTREVRKVVKPESLVPGTPGVSPGDK